MRILALRASTRHIRYCVLESDGQDIRWLNKDDEHIWSVPKASKSKSDALVDVHQELSRLLSKYKPDLVAIKVAETVHGNPDPKRVSVEAVIILAAAQNHVQVVERRYRDLKTNSKEVEDFVLIYFAKTETYWDIEIADALATGLRELGK